MGCSHPEAAGRGSISTWSAPGGVSQSTYAHDLQGFPDSILLHYGHFLDSR